MTTKKTYVDFGEMAIVDAMKDGDPAFSYTYTGPEELIPRPLSEEEREASRRSSLDCRYVRPSRRPQSKRST